MFTHACESTLYVETTWLSQLKNTAYQRRFSSVFLSNESDCSTDIVHCLVVFAIMRHLAANPTALCRSQLVANSFLLLLMRCQGIRRAGSGLPPSGNFPRTA